MSSFSEDLRVTQISKDSSYPKLILKNSRLLRSKENSFKLKCNKRLKKKLKKYKLRRNGEEDPDIIDVSKTLVSSLQIKSPNSLEIKRIKNLDPEKVSPKNYLFKMIRKKSTCGIVNTKINEINTGGQEKNGKCDEKFTLSDISNESKEMNAFKLMMESRNKIIGSNSPGKEKLVDENDATEIFMKKEIRAKRNLVLQKMAQKKGSSKNQQSEDLRDECNKKKLEKRATRLKQMISSDNCQNIDKKVMIKAKSTDITIETENINDFKEKKPKLLTGKLQLFNFLSDGNSSCSDSQENLELTQEDEEFLKKLSPSIRKKENMLSYFKKITKDSQGQETQNLSEASIIKVKVACKTKKKIKQDTPSVLLDDKSSNMLENVETHTKVRKRKRDNFTISNETNKSSRQNDKEIDNHSNRPKRAVKKPVKYSSDISYSSSEELHIITPKKKKSVGNKNDIVHNDKLEINKNETIKAVIKGNSIKKESSPKTKYLSNQSKHTNNLTTHKSNKSNVKSTNNKSLKLAPIFSTRTKLTTEEQEAKEQFLKSGVPDKLKVKQNRSNDEIPWNHFSTVVHVQQTISSKSQTNIQFDKDHKCVDWLDMARITIEETSDYNYNYNFSLNSTTQNLKHIVIKPYIKNKPDQLLKLMKHRYSKFPVYRTYNLLKSKRTFENVHSNLFELDNSVEIIEENVDINCDNPHKLNWNEKYKPMSSNQIIGNFESVKELKRWLELWDENLKRSNKNHYYESDLSDFCFSDSETDSRDALNHTNNVLVISGPSGTGKTSCVYAVASELAIKVIEVNASSKRTGKIMLQDLQEATQSHKVNRSNLRDSSQSSQDKREPLYSKIVKKHGRPKKTYKKKSKYVETPKIDVSSQTSQTSTQDNPRTGMSLILIDDADIIFDQDDGFCSAVSQLIHSSKRPVILITSSLTCPHLQKYISYGKIVRMSPLLPRMLGTWLDIMCLVDTGTCYPGLGCKLLDYFRGDIRKTTNFLQFYMTADKALNQTEDMSQDLQDYKVDIDDECSNMSWAAHDNITKLTSTEDHTIDESQEVFDRQIMSLQPDSSLDLINVWWSISNHLDCKSLPETKVNTSDNIQTKLNNIAKILDNISFVDCMILNKNSNAHNLMSRPWLSDEVPSVLERENLEYHNIVNENTKFISNDIIEKSFLLINNWQYSAKCPPSMSLQRERNRILSQHNGLSSYLNPSAILDRRALALDYWATCRSICRLEKNKTVNLKRNNRFCHYLKSLNILCKNDYFDGLSESLI